MSPIQKPVSVQPTVALCYVRLSLTRDESDLNSPERQKANILAECERRGWIPEWYEDTEGHKSGTTVDNRPQWLALENRLNDPDVVGVVANDLARLHRKGWRVGRLLDFLDKRGIALVLGAPGRNFDFSGPQGRMMILLIAMMDEWYAMDTSERQKDSIRFRRSKGLPVGRIPFGTKRGKDGYLQRLPDGVWLLTNGMYIKGIEGDTAPVETAIWRGFADAAHRCLELFTQNGSGRRKIAAKLNAEGYRFRNVDGKIALFNPDDVRRITANWVEYGGGMLPGKARIRRGKNLNPETITLNPERAVFPVELCAQVGHVLKLRSRDLKRNPDYAIHLDAKMYPLSKLVFCAHCERLAQKEGNSQTRSYLTGKTGKQKMSRRYRHDTDRRCNTAIRSINADMLEHDFVRLLKSLTVSPDALPVLAQALEYFNSQNQPEDQITLIQAEIAHWQQKAKNADTLFGNARISEEDWRAMVENANHEIARLQSQIAEEKEAEKELQVTLDMIVNLVQNWHQSNPETRRVFANSLFEYVVYDLEIQQIVDYKLKPWAELLMQLKVTLDDGKKLPPASSESKGVLRRAWRGSSHQQDHCLPSEMLRALSFASSMATVQQNYNRGKSYSAMLKFIAVI